jgi:hypothetical protein
VKRFSLITVSVCSFLLSSLVFTTGLAATPLASTVLRFEPTTVEFGPDYCVNDTVTLAARIDDVDDLWAFDLFTEWNTTYLEYVDHVAKVPVEAYTDGLLHEPVLLIRDDVNASEGQYWVAVSSLYPASGFYGSGTAFEITFRIKDQPVDPAPEVSFLVEFTEHNFLDSNTMIPHLVEHCNVTIYPHWNPADLNDDLKVDIYDVVLCVRAYQSTPADPRWNPRCDLAEPYGVVDLFDIMVIAGSYGEAWASP